MATYIGLMVQISAEYLSNERKRTNRFFIQRKNPSMPLTFHSKINIRIRLQLELFFLKECLPQIVNRSEKRLAFFLKKIASIGVWGNGRFPQLNLPSALAVAKQGYSFLFA
jgi:hypothetical protein